MEHAFEEMCTNKAAGIIKQSISVHSFNMRTNRQSRTELKTVWTKRLFMMFNIISRETDEQIKNK